MNGIEGVNRSGIWGAGSLIEVDPTMRSEVRMEEEGEG